MTEKRDKEESKALTKKYKIKKDKNNELNGSEEELIIHETEEKEKKRAAIDAEIITAKKRKKPKNLCTNLESAERFFPDVENGLTNEQVLDRIEKGYINYTSKKKAKTYGSIFISNIFTFFNILTFIVGGALIATGNNDFGNLFFLVIIAANITIGILQEIRSKRMIDRLSLISAPSATVIRNNERKVIPISEIVLDDIIYVETGKQISADSTVVSGSCEVNESMLTGESEPVKKIKGDVLYSGSFVSSGSCYARVNKIGDSNYIEALTSHAKRYKKPKSELQSSIRFIMKVVTCFIIPIAFAMIYRDFKVWDWETFSEKIGDSVEKWAGSIIGMIPAGMFLLTSMALAVGVLRLGKRNTLVQDLYCIEMLARADVLCLDKTGTLTDGSMQVNNVVPLFKDDNAESKIAKIIGSMLTATEDNNQTALALAAKFGYSTDFIARKILPFSSQRKYSAVTFEEEGTFLLGAPEYVIKDMDLKVERMISDFASQGYRVICLAQSSSEIENNELRLNSTKPLALIIIEDHIREDAYETIRWFKENDVTVKIISGDNPVTVSEVAKRVGVENADLYISLDGLSSQEVIEAANKYTVFGRVTPEQKSLLVKSLKAKGHTVAMTGDGVNDILAMREADCAISIASGAEAARNVSHLVLLDSRFSSMPNVVMEGRRVVNNITKSASLFLTKTFMSIMLSILFLLLGEDYLFGTKNLLPLELFVIGLPSFALALQANNNRIKGNFLANVVSRAIPGGMALFISVFGTYLYQKGVNQIAIGDWVHLEINKETAITLYVLALSYTGIIVLGKICEPFNVFRVFVFLFSIFIMSVSIFLLSGVSASFFGIQQLKLADNYANFMHLIFIAFIVLLSYFIITLIMRVLKALKIMYDV